MKRISTVVAGACTIALALGASPAYAQYANEYSIAKVIKQGTTTHSIAGSGTVTVQVQVNANGTHKVIRILHSTNRGDDAAAMDIAQSSTYRPAHRGKTPITTFYDFVLKFNGKAVAPPDETAGGGAAAGQVDALIRSKQYDAAIGKANAALLDSPGNPTLLQLLGIAQFFKGDVDGAAASFSRVDTYNKDFKSLAAQALASGAVKISPTDPATAMSYAQKAVSLANDTNSLFALGVAQIANKQYADALATLKPLPSKAPDTKTKVAIDRELLTAYLASNDMTSANALAAEMKTLDPTSDAAGMAMANYYLTAGNQAIAAKQLDAAEKDFAQAAATGITQAVVTGNIQAAFAVMSMQKPDYSKARDYAVKAVTAAPNDATANFAAGVAWTGVYSKSRSSSDKQQALTYLKKADELAKAAGNTGLSLQIENQLKNIPQ